MLVLDVPRAAASELAEPRGPRVDDRGIDLHWDAPLGCPDAEQVREHARRRMVRNPTSPLVVHASVQRIEGATWRLTMSLRGAAGSETREIRASSCDALAEAAGLLIAVASDPELATEPEPSSEPVPDPSLDPSVDPSRDPSQPTDPKIETTDSEARDVDRKPAPPPDTTRASKSSDTRSRARRARIDGAIRAEVGGQFLRVLPQPAGVTLGGALVLRTRWARAELRARHAFAQRVQYDAPSDTGGTVALTTASAHGCFAPRWRRLELPVCAGLELGAMRARSFGVTDNGAAAAVFAALPVDVALVWAPIPRVGLVAGAGVSPTLRRPSFHVRDLDRLFVAGPLALRVVLGVEVRFP